MWKWNLNFSRVWICCRHFCNWPTVDRCYSFNSSSDKTYKRLTSTCIFPHLRATLACNCCSLCRTFSVKDFGLGFCSVDRAQYSTYLCGKSSHWDNWLRRDIYVFSLRRIRAALKYLWQQIILQLKLQELCVKTLWTCCNLQEQGAIIFF